MSDCPDCENKAVETEEVKVEAAEKDVEVAIEEKAEEVKAAETCVCKKIAKSIARIIAGIIIIAGIVFLVFRHEIQRVWYEERENSTVIEMIKSDLIIAELPGNAGEDFTYEIKYVDEGHPNPNYYEVIISSDAFAEGPQSFKVYAAYDTVKGELSLNFEGNGETDFKSIQSRMKQAKKISKTVKEADKVEEKAEEVKAEVNKAADTVVDGAAKLLNSAK